MTIRPSLKQNSVEENIVCVCFLFFDLAFFYSAISKTVFKMPQKKKNNNQKHAVNFKCDCYISNKNYL